MKNRDYWRNRSVELKKSLLNKSESYYKDLETQYDIALKNIEKDIYSWYMRFANNNKLSYQDAKKLLNSKELKELRWDINEYIKRGVDNKKWLKELENASCKAHITRLECLEFQIKQQVNNLYSNELKDVEKLMSDICKENYYHNAYEIAKGTGLGMLVKLDVNKINKVIGKPWVHDGINFSERIWGKHRTELINYLHAELTQSIIRGENPQKLINKISKKFNVSKSKAGNLVMTESAFFSAESQKDCFNDLGVEEYEIVATLDLKTSEICQEMDGKVFKMSEYEVGVTANPFHSYCRTCTAPYFNDEFTQDEKRVARGPDGKTYEVPSDMKYKEWYKKYVVDDDMVHAQDVKITKKNIDNEYSVNRTLVNSKKYHDKFENLPLGKDTRENVYRESKRILENTDGTNTENLVIMDYKTGKEIVSNRTRISELKTGLTKEQYDKVMQHKGDIIILHNHPGGGRLSYTDIKTAYRNNKVAMSIVSGSDGTLHYIHNINRDINVESIYLEWYNFYKKNNYNNSIAKIKATNRIYELEPFEYVVR